MTSTASSFACQLVKSFLQWSLLAILVRDKAKYSLSVKSFLQWSLLAILLRDKAKYSLTGVRNQLKCRGSKPRLHMTHHEVVVSLTIITLLSSVSSHRKVNRMVHRTVHKIVQRIKHFFALSKEWGGPNLAGIHIGRSCICFKEPHVDVYLLVYQVMLPYQLFDAESTSCEWT